MKLNTVVCKVNLNDDMSDLALELKPERWKIFEVLPVDGQNDGDVDELLLEKGEFETWLKRHSWVSNTGIPFISESNDEMRGSYAMLDALGRFYTNDGGGHEYGPSILDIGVMPAWKNNIFHEDKFLSRGGVYDWEVAK
jgi:radical S-adenosyl methionine domain-containing protein 2